MESKYWEQVAQSLRTDPKFQEQAVQKGSVYLTITADGKNTYTCAECLGSSHGADMGIVTHRYNCKYCPASQLDCPASTASVRLFVPQVNLLAPIMRPARKMM